MSSKAASVAVGSSESKAPEIPDGFESITEGLATAVFRKGEVFYNNVQCFNRDISIVMIKAFIEQRKKEHEEKQQLAKEKEDSKQKAAEDSGRAGGANEEKCAVGDKKLEGVRILEALSATGLRSVRYWKEIPVHPDDIHSICVNDISPDAVDAIKRNVEFNGLPVDRVIPNLGDANMVMHSHSSKSQNFDVIDLDPYGSASVFIDPAVQAIAEGGLLAVTCTDKATLCGNHTDACFSKYGSMSLRGVSYCHEMAVRIVLASLATAAARHKRYIVPLVSLSIDFYVRVFVRVYTSPLEVKKAASKLANFFQCIGCKSFHLLPLGKVIEQGKSVKYTPSLGPDFGPNCADCGSRFRMGGPVWYPAMHDVSWVDAALREVRQDPTRYNTHARIDAMLSVVREELPVPFFYTLASLCNVLHISSFKATEFRSAFINAGYKVSPTHCGPDGLKTDAPPRAVWDILRGQVKRLIAAGHKLRELSPETPAYRILAQEPEIKADFSSAAGAEFDKSKIRFMPNPEANWGPKTRAKRKKDDGRAEMSMEEKRRANQGKRTKKRKVCMYFARDGVCKAGDSCTYIHDAKAGDPYAARRAADKAAGIAAKADAAAPATTETNMSD